MVPPQATESSAPTSHGSVNYDQTLKYWGGVSADDCGMLGGVPKWKGYANINKVDLHGSRSFLAKLGVGENNGRQIVENALEGGAGIGRVTEGLLLHVAKEVDIIEPIPKFTLALHGKPGIRSIQNINEELLEHLGHCKSALKSPDGLIVIKENISTSGQDIYDDEDGGVTRGDGKFRKLFKEAGLRIVKVEIQKGMNPPNAEKLFPVKMYALKPEALELEKEQ
ncbi:Alpha N-terminal protein methyltransferase 1 like [Verticillium longisporum]|nr:Alpha N-terminal protein methyltransferase 1 like [Verticillium longisporum]